MNAQTKQTSHTPGPWSYTFDKTVQGIPAYRIDSATLSCMASLVIGDDTVADEVKANARLIAAAPELLQLLSVTVSYLDPRSELYGQVRRAIAKAKGG
jgi:hypothetical protein